MSITAAQLMVRVSADTAAAQAGLGGLTGMMGGASLGAAGVVAAVAGIGIASTVMAGNFQQNMTQLVTGAGESQSNIKAVSDGILKMAVDTGTSTKQLSDGMYMIESAGYHGKAGLDVLQAAAEGAKVGNADLGTVADAVTTTMKDFADQNVNASQATNALIATVASGKTHMTDLAGALANVAPTASTAKVKLNDMMGALATMTGEGVPAADAATYLRQTIIALDAPSKQAKDALAGVGLSSSQVAADMQKSLPDALKEITDAVGKKFPVGSAGYVNALKDIMGGSKQLQGILDLSGDHMKDFQTNTQSVGDAVKKGGDKITGWNQVQGDFNQHMAKAKEKVETMMISLGQHLLPTVQNLVDLFVTKVLPTLERFASWLTGNSPTVQAFRIALVSVALAVGIMLVPAFISWAAAAAAAAAATFIAALPVILITAGIALLIAGIILLVTHWKVVTDTLGKFKDGVGKDVGDAFSGLGTIVHNVWDGIQKAIKGAINGVIGDINNFIGFIDSIQIHIPAVGVGPVHTDAFNWNGLGIPKIPLLAQGGDVAPGGAAIVGDAGMELLTVGSRGARVTPLPGGMSGRASAGSGSGAPMTLVLQVDGRTLAQIVTKYQPGVIRQATGARAF